MARPGGQPRFHVSQLDSPIVVFDPLQSAHATKVLRLAVGDTVELFDGRGGLGQAVIETVERHKSRGGVACRVLVETIHRESAPASSVVIASAIPKGDAAEGMVDMLSQVGASRWLPRNCERSVVTPRPAKLAKFERIAIESAKQCGRRWIMQIDPPMAFEDVIQRGADRKLICLREAKNDQNAGDASVTQTLMLVGPEGGFGDKEITVALAAGFTPCRLGKHVLRIETAAVVAVALANRFSATLPV